MQISSTSFSINPLEQASRPAGPRGEAAAQKSEKTGLTQEEERALAELKQRDREVRTHEAAHQAAAGSHASGGASFSYTRGPDGQQYATGGEVSIDTSPVAGDPAATLRKAQTLQQAALAPAEPSAQDRQVAADAAVMAAQARQELSREGQVADAKHRDAEDQTGGADNLLQRFRSSGSLAVEERAENTRYHLVA